MKKARQQVNSLTERINLHLKKVCSDLSPQKRMIAILFLCSSFGVVSIYMTANSFYSIWKSDRQTNPIHQLNKESGQPKSESAADSIIKSSKHLEYEWKSNN
jgi:hypothetical protein